MNVRVLNIQLFLFLRNTFFEIINRTQVNRILKQTYLKDKTLNFEELENYLDQVIDEYNNIKPHYFHKIYTPTEDRKSTRLNSSH